MFRLITCRQASLLIEQRTDAALPPTERRSLWLHLRYCAYCSRYARQTALINELARTTAARHSADAPGLPPEARARLQARLAAAGAGPAAE